MATENVSLTANVIPTLKVNVLENISSGVIFPTNYNSPTTNVNLTYNYNMDELNTFGKTGLAIENKVGTSYEWTWSEKELSGQGSDIVYEKIQ